jgi:hypothetical protein
VVIHVETDVVKVFAPGSGTPEDGTTSLVQWAQTLDDLGGLMPREDLLQLDLPQGSLHSSGYPC